jgi:hypothetical protein
MKIAAQDKTGKPIIVEKDIYFPNTQLLWHDPTRPHRFFLSFEQAADIAELFPEFVIDLSAAKLPVYKGELNGLAGKFYYFNELFQHHRTAIVEAGGVIEDRI